ncbi:protein phosphatase 1 regulatory subunit 3C-B-like [Limulus polyphemus]|uniref:Protein phosphatase 1 regulatory subunit n=1 Tax=Limulus polyphemus TaxID=6850 RepID=A0ABM1SVY9_LIMPO|nr:protein phosphatase 1 regulatory subunit 3C-B-like [Limulus polyphemus]
MIIPDNSPIFPHDFFTNYRCTASTYPYRDVISYSGNAPQYSEMPPIRSCLAARDEDDVSHEKQRYPKPCKGEKRVCFADDKGLALTHVRIMKETSDCPPSWTDQFLAQVTQGIKTEEEEEIENRWEVTFPQPASEYMEFRNKLEQQRVSLENVIIKNREISGTIKVKNVCFKKDVFVRVTFNCWSSFEDFPANYVNNGLGDMTSLFDTFSFSVSIPSVAYKYEAIEFCVCFSCESSEFWDNNGGANYRILTVRKKRAEDHSKLEKFVDAVTADFSSWASFASWNHLPTEGPYW